ncbi:hypothetical protein [Herbaspirillum sp. RV1423]|uniref:hypothetical protein n=1 Tax=Herbaspirillum sp. RV1423 TaxID=1443993 RepID=UPI00054D0EAE|nr:hypothetical protein [Herbaspirillum sp. RV1423]
MTKDNGSWLSAEQAVMPDGTERANLPLINKKLPTLSQSPTGEDASASESTDVQSPQATGAADK